MQRGCAGGSGRGYYAPGLRVDVPGRPSLGCSRPFTSCGPGEMRNERLRALLLERGKSPDQLAEHVRVDAKTVERWITRGRLPYRRHRFEVASFLGVDESYIWPDALGQRRGRGGVGERDRGGVAAPLRGAPGHVGTPVLRRPSGRSACWSTPGCSCPRTRACRRSSRTRPAAGVRVRILLGDPDSQVVADRGDDEGIGDAHGRQDPQRAGAVPAAAAGGGCGVPVPPHGAVQLDLPRR